MSENNDELFSLLVNISVSSESTLERLTNSLKVLVKKYFDTKDFTEPENVKDVLFDSILKVEAILYTLYEIENLANDELKKLEILYYKDVVLKVLFVITSLDFFIDVLKENDLFEDAVQLRDKVKQEFQILANQKNNNNYNYVSENIETRFFSEIKPQDYRKSQNLTIKNDNKFLEDIQNKNLSLISILKQKIKSKSKPPKPKIDSEGKKFIRTATGWEIPADFFEDKI